MKKLIIVVIALVSFMGCATFSDLISMKEKGEGITKTYPVNLDQAWKISKTVLRWEVGNLIEEQPDEGYMLTRSAGANGIIILAGVWIKSVDNDSTTVTVITKRQCFLPIALGITETSFHVHFIQAVNILKEGKPLPIKMPVDKKEE